MRSFLTVLILSGLLGGGMLGCNTERDKGINRDKDRPKPPEEKKQA